MNVLIVVDKVESAIYRLALPIKRHNPQLNVEILPVHPKRPDMETLAVLQEKMQWADLIDVHYWRSGNILRQHQEALFNQKKKIVCHFNPYDIDKEVWLDTYSAVTVGNKSIHINAPYARLIPYAIDLDFWTFSQDYTEEKVVNMTVARIEGKKGVREVAQVCRELGYKFMLVGRISSGEYFQEIMSVNPDTVFKENITDEELREEYYKSAVHVCNSVDGFESGTLPILEAMACGVPILTRRVGHVPDLEDGSNMVVREGSTEDIKGLRNDLVGLMENREQRLKIREKAWQTVKNRNDKKMARQYARLYYEVMAEGKLSASVIIPTYDRQGVIVDVLAAAISQDAPFYEVIVVDSGNDPVGPVVEEFQKQSRVPIKYIWFENHGEYTLAKARNIGAMEAMGQVLVFCDDRLVMEKDAVSKFLESAGRNTWSWGIKDDYEKPFVENFSSIYRDDFWRLGGFNERLDVYGGMTQEVRTRYEKLNGLFMKMVKANAKSVAKSGSKWRRKNDIAEAKLRLYKLYGEVEE